LEAQTAAPLVELAPLLADIPPARLFEEVCKLFLSGHAGATFAAMRRHAMFGALFPLSEEVLVADTGGTLTRFVASALDSTDSRVQAGEPVTIAFLLAAFLWPPISRYAQWLEQEEGMGEAAAVQRATAVVLGESKQRVSIPQRFALPLRDVVQLQTRFRYRHGKRAEGLLAHPRFRAAYDFLKLRAEAGDAEPVLVEFWDQVQRANGEERRKLLTSAQRRRRR